MHDFEKKPKKSYAIENSYTNQLDFSINEMMFINAQHQIVDKFENKEEFKHLKLRFLVVLGKELEEFWSLVKIVRVLNISKDVFFEDVLQNFCYHVVRVDNTTFDFSVANFPLMNLNDLIQLARILKGIDAMKLQGTSKDEYPLGLAHIKLFIDNYYDCLALTDVELALAMGKEITVHQSLLKSQANLKKCVDGEICLKPLGIVFVGKSKKGKNTKFLFQACDVERYTTTDYTNLLVRMNSCKKNNDGDKVRLKNVMNWYFEIRRPMHQAIQMLMT